MHLFAILLIGKKCHEIEQKTQILVIQQGAFADLAR